MPAILLAQLVLCTQQARSVVLVLRTLAVGKEKEKQPAEGPFALSEPGKLEALMEQAGLTPRASGDVSCPFEYPDDETAWKGHSSPGPLVGAIRYADEDNIKKALLDSLAPYKTASGGYRQENSFRYMIAMV